MTSDEESAITGFFKVYHRFVEESNPSSFEGVFQFGGGNS
jgi:hypothetical protein